MPSVERTKNTNILEFLKLCARRSSLEVSAQDSRWRGVGSRPGGIIVLCSWAKHVHQRGGGGLDPPHPTTQPTSRPWATQCLKDVKSIKHG